MPHHVHFTLGPLTTWHWLPSASDARQQENDPDRSCKDFYNLISEVTHILSLYHSITLSHSQTTPGRVEEGLYQSVNSRRGGSLGTLSKAGYHSYILQNHSIAEDLNRYRICRVALCIFQIPNILRSILSIKQLFYVKHRVSSKQKCLNYPTIASPTLLYEQTHFLSGCKKIKDFINEFRDPDSY